jgi:hypothetical protein
MSKSYRKPYVSDYSRYYTYWAKRQASKQVRRYKKVIQDGASYKKVHPTWNIHDYKGSCYASSMDLTEENIELEKQVRRK